MGGWLGDRAGHCYLHVIGWQDHDLVLCTGIGTPINPGNLKRDDDRLVALASVLRSCLPFWPRLGPSCCRIRGQSLIWLASYPTAVGGVCPPRKRGPRAVAGLQPIKLSRLRQR